MCGLRTLRYRSRLGRSPPARPSTPGHVSHAAAGRSRERVTAHIGCRSSSAGRSRGAFNAPDQSTNRLPGCGDRTDDSTVAVLIADPGSPTDLCLGVIASGRHRRSPSLALIDGLPALNCENSSCRPVVSMGVHPAITVGWPAVEVRAEKLCCIRVLASSCAVSGFSAGTVRRRALSGCP